VSQREQLALASKVIHGGGQQQRPPEPVAGALFQSVNFVEPLPEADNLRYPRYGNTPNAERVQARLAALEGGERALVLSSGMAAVACALLALLRPGDHLLASEWIYGGVRRLFDEEFPNLGVAMTLVNPAVPRDWRRNLRRETRAIFLETPTNPTCRVIDMRPIRHLARQQGIALVVDSTFASPVNFRPLEHGADVVIHSATKYLNGHDDVLAGVVVGTSSYVEEVRRKMLLWGQAPDPFACWLLERGLKTLDVRVRRQNENAMRIAEWLAERREIQQVHYPGLASHPDHKVAAAQLSGFGGMLAFELAGGARAAERFMKRLRLVKPAPSLGGVETLVSEPRRTSHAHLSAAQRAALGIPDGFVRMSVGIEDVADIIQDLAQALR
jgi:cystathionine beta-lyase/cystathionine gamma-synthase